MEIINSIFDTVKNLDSKVKKIMVSGLYFSLAVSIIGTLFLVYYISLKSSAFIYYIGINVVTLSFSFSAAFLACALVIDRIKKDLE